MNEKATGRGFTLIEIMVVVVIIGLLAGLVGPAVWDMLGFGKESIAETKCKEIYDRAELFKEVKHKVPRSMEDIAEPLSRGGQRYPVEDDPWGNPYRLETDGNKIRVFSNGPDGQEGTDDDISYPSIEE